MNNPGNVFGQQPGNGGPVGGGNGNQWGNPSGQGFGGGNAAGGGNPYGSGPGAGAAQPQGAGAGGFGGFGGPAPDPNHGSAPENDTRVITAVVAALAVLVVVGGAAWWFLAGSDNREKSEIADAANAAAEQTLDMSDQEFIPQDADDVTFTNDEKTRASVGAGSDEVLMAKEEEGEWKVCDPELDFTLYEGGAELADSFDPENW